MNESTIELLNKYSFNSTEINLSYEKIEGILDFNGYNNEIDVEKLKIQ